MSSFIMHASYSQSSMYPDILYGGCSVGIVPSSSQRQCKAVWTPGAIGHILQCPTTAHSPSHPSSTVGHLLSRLPHLPCKPTVPSAAAQLSVILMFPPFPPRIPPSPSGHHPALCPQEIILSIPSQEQSAPSSPEQLAALSRAGGFPLPKQLAFPPGAFAPFPGAFSCLNRAFSVA